MEGRYTAGERLSTEALRTEFGVSKQPVMEAMRRLAGDGLIEIVPQVGSRVATFTPREVERLLRHVRRLRRHDRRHRRAAPHHTAARRAGEDLRQIGALRSSPDTRRPRSRLPRLNRRFHHAIHDMAHSRIMGDTSRRMWDLSDFLINTSDVPQPFSCCPGRPARRPRAHPRRAARQRPGDRACRDGTSTSSAPSTSSAHKLRAADCRGFTMVGTDMHARAASAAPRPAAARTVGACASSALPTAAACIAAGRRARTPRPRFPSARPVQEGHASLVPHPEPGARRRRSGRDAQEQGLALAAAAAQRRPRRVRRRGDPAPAPGAARGGRPTRRPGGPSRSRHR